jgi:hypothetical protein
MATELADIANNAGIKISGFGDQLDGSGQVTAAQLTANDDKVSQAINTKYPVVRQRVIKDFAAMKNPFRETSKFASLGLDLKQYDLAIESIVSSGGVVTVTTQEAHGRSTGNTVYLAEIEQDGDEDFDDIEGTLITSLNGTTKTITVTTTTAFTLDSTTGVDSTWAHQENTGIVSYVPEIGPWQYAFKLPSDYFCIVRQTDESPSTQKGVKTTYQNKPILNKDGNGFILLTNSLTNLGGDTAYIEYCIDQTTFSLFSPEFEECIAMLLAAELCPIVGRNLETRQAILAEYEQKTIPDAQRAIQSQGDNTSRFIPDFSGGRSGMGAVPVQRRSLGTYLDAQGNRRSIF